jgi:hypothetical protein
VTNQEANAIIAKWMGVAEDYPLPCRWNRALTGDAHTGNHYAVCLTHPGGTCHYWPVPNELVCDMADPTPDCCGDWRELMKALRKAYGMLHATPRANQPWNDFCAHMGDKWLISGGSIYTAHALAKAIQTQEQGAREGNLRRGESP